MTRLSLADTRQRSLLLEAVAETREALETVEENADRMWLDEALAAVKRVCLALPDFISDQIWDVGGLTSTREDRALGSVLMKAKRLGWCVKTDRGRPSRRSHMALKPVWSSLLWKGAE